MHSPTPPYISYTFLVVAVMYNIHMVVFTDRWLNLEANAIQLDSYKGMSFDCS